MKVVRIAAALLTIAALTVVADGPRKFADQAHQVELKVLTQEQEIVKTSKSQQAYITQLKNKIAATEEFEQAARFGIDHISEVPYLRSVLRMAQSATSLEDLDAKLNKEINDLKFYRMSE